MEIVRFNIVNPERLARIEIFKLQTNNCSYCGQKLLFNYWVKKENHKIEEEAYCPSCKIKKKSEYHDLH